MLRHLTNPRHLWPVRLCILRHPPNLFRSHNRQYRPTRSRTPILLMLLHPIRPGQAQSLRVVMGDLSTRRGRKSQRKTSSRSRKKSVLWSISSTPSCPPSGHQQALVVSHRLRAFRHQRYEPLPRVLVPAHRPRLPALVPRVSRPRPRPRLKKPSHLHPVGGPVQLVGVVAEGLGARKVP